VKTDRVEREKDKRNTRDGILKFFSVLNKLQYSVKNMKKNDGEKIIVTKKDRCKEIGKNGQLALDAAIIKAAQEAGKKYGDKGLVSYLEAQAHAAPSPFLTLLGKILAREEEQTIPPITRIEIVAPKWNNNDKMELENQ